MFRQARVQLPEAAQFGLRSCKAVLKQASMYMSRFWESGRSRSMQASCVLWGNVTLSSQHKTAL